MFYQAVLLSPIFVHGRWSTATRPQTRPMLPFYFLSMKPTLPPFSAQENSLGRRAPESFSLDLWESIYSTVRKNPSTVRKNPSTVRKNPSTVRKNPSTACQQQGGALPKFPKCPQHSRYFIPKTAKPDSPFFYQNTMQ